MIDLNFYRERLDYIPETGELLHRKNSGRGRTGCPAGALDEKGYLRITFSIGGRSANARAHRIAWALYYGEWPPGEIDHINGNRADNRISNLRLASRSQNLMNKPTRGVCFDARRGKWYARIKAYGKSTWLGYFDTEESALSAYRAAAPVIHGEFARWA